MIKKILICFNLLLLVTFIYHYNTLYQTINTVPEYNLTLPVFDFADLKQPVVEKSKSYNHLFGVKLPLTDNSKKHSDGSMEQFQIGKDIVRVKGIFIKNNQSFAVLEVLSGGKEKARSQQLHRLVLGDGLSGYVLTVITPGSITLTHPQNATVTLKLFDSKVKSKF